MNLQEELKALKKRIAELEELAKEEKEFPQEDDVFCFINTFGKPVESTWGESITNRQLIEIGNMFRTKEQAEFAVEKLKVEAELRKFSRPFEYGENCTEFYYDHEFGRITFLTLTASQTQGAIYFESKEKAQQAIESVGIDRIKKYIFGVEG